MLGSKAQKATLDNMEAAAIPNENIGAFRADI